jgi:8-oxo-dGTP pyrophosphatase MutT (NUDIX family)
MFQLLLDPSAPPADKTSQATFYLREEPNPSDGSDVVLAATSGGGEQQGSGFSPVTVGHAVTGVPRGSEECPAFGLCRLNAQDAAETRAMRLAVCTLIVDSAGSVLLTRRPAHMRSFPLAWVVPGGGVELGETLAQAGRREALEETGVQLTAADCCSDGADGVSHGAIDRAPLCCWESCFPTTVDACRSSATGLQVLRPSNPLLTHFQMNWNAQFASA